MKFNKKHKMPATEKMDSLVKLNIVQIKSQTKQNISPPKLVTIHNTGEKPCQGHELTNICFYFNNKPIAFLETTKISTNFPLLTNPISLDK